MSENEETVQNCDAYIGPTCWHPEDLVPRDPPSHSTINSHPPQTEETFAELSSPRGCAKYTSQHTEFLSCQRFFSLFCSFTCDGSFSDESVGVVFKVICDGKVTMLSHPNSSKFRFRNLPRSPTISRLYLRHSFLTQRSICQTNQEIVNMCSNDPF